MIKDILITPLRTDSKKIVINTNKEYENSEIRINLLKDRFNLLKKCYKRISILITIN
jgi:hypothetical protein